MALLGLGLGSGQSDNHFARFAYSPGNIDHAIYMFKVDPVTGNLLENGSIATGAENHEILVHPTGKFAFAGGYFGPGTAPIYKIFAFRIDQSSRKLIPNGVLPVQGSLSIAMDPGGHFIYSTGGGAGGSVSSFSIDQDNGTLSPVASVGNRTYFGVVSTSNNFVYATASLSGLDSYAVDSAGNLSQSNTTFVRDERIVVDSVSGSDPYFASYMFTGNQGQTYYYTPHLYSGIGPFAFAVDPQSRFLFIGLIGSFSYTNIYTQLNILVYSIDATTGALTWKATVEDQPKANSHNDIWPTAIITDPRGKFLYVTAANGSTVRVFSIDRNSGNLTNLQETDPITDRQGEGAPGGAVMDPSGKILYVTRWGALPSTILTFRVDEHGIIGAQTGLIQAGQHCRQIALVP